MMTESSISNLPSWPGASVVYSRCYRLLGRMARNGHVARRRGRCVTSAEMDTIIDALNRGDEEYLKGILLEACDGDG
jgi:hypothetical protein